MRKTPGTLAALALLHAAAGLAPTPAAAQEAAADRSAASAPATATEAAQGSGVAQEARAEGGITGTTVLLAGESARLELEMASGETHEIELNSGHVLVDGRRRGTYEPGGAFEAAWRDLLRSPALGEAAALPDLLAGFDPPAAGDGATGSGRDAVLEALGRFLTEPAAPAATAAGQEAGPDERVTIVPRAGSIGQLAERLRELNETLGRISGEQFRLDGDFALIVHDDYRIANGRSVTGDVALLGGQLTVDGEIEGDVLVLDGELLLEPGSVVHGDVRSLGGEVETTGATVTGEILTLSAVDRIAERADGEARAVERDAEQWKEWNGDRGPGVFGRITRSIERTVGDLVGTIVWLIGLTLVGALFVYFVPARLEAIATEARTDVLRSFGVGLAGQLLFFPILLLLVVMIVTWLVVPFYVVAVALAIPAGYIAVARGLGEAVVDRDYELFERFNLNRQNTYYYVLNGLIVLLSPFAIAAVLQLFGSWFGFLRGLALFIGIVLAWASATAGFGAVILTRGGGLVRSLPSFRRKRSVPLDDLRPKTASDESWTEMPPEGDEPGTDSEGEASKDV